MSSRNGGYLPVISPAYPATRSGCPLLLSAPAAAAAAAAAAGARFLGRIAAVTFGKRTARVRATRVRAGLARARRFGRVLDDLYPFRAGLAGLAGARFGRVPLRGGALVGLGGLSGQSMGR
jgi:hypothetical protein